MDILHLEQLGRKLVSLKMRRHAERCRELYAVMRAGHGKAEWSLEHATRLANIVGVGPKPLEVRDATARCNCGAGLTPRTVVHLEDRYVMACATECGREWVVLLDAHPSDVEAI